MIDRATLEMLQERAARGDGDALNRALLLLESTLVAEARTFWRRGLDLDELVQRCRIAATRSLRTWQPNCGTSIVSYVKTCVRRAMIDAIRQHVRNRERERGEDRIEDREHDRLGEVSDGGNRSYECIHVIPEPYIRAWVERELLFTDAPRHAESVALLKALAPILELSSASAVVDRVAAELEVCQWGLFDDDGLDGKMLDEAIASIVSVLMAALSAIASGDDVHAFEGNARARSLAVRLARSCARDYFQPRQQQQANAS